MPNEGVWHSNGSLADEDVLVTMTVLKRDIPNHVAQERRKMGDT
jgi:hypothetical protein